MRKFFFSIGILLFIGGIVVTSIGFINSDMSNIFDFIPEISTGYTRKLHGDGNVIEKSIAYDESSDIEIHLPSKNKTKIYFDESLATIELKTDKNIIDEIVIDKQVGKVILEFENSKTLGMPTNDIKIYLPDTMRKIILKGISTFDDIAPTFKNNKHIEVKGTLAGELNCGNIDELIIDSIGVISDFTVTGNFKKINFTTKGVSDIDFKGSVQQLLINKLGVGDISAFELHALRASISLKGTGNIEVYATEYLKVDLSGVGDVTYKGNPTTEFNKKGIGEINKK